MKKKPRPFKWNGLFWHNEVLLGKTLLDVGILASEGQPEIVVELEAIAFRFPEFWEKNKDEIVDATRKWLEKLGAKNDLRPKQCSLETVVLSAGWTVGVFLDKQRQRKKFFELLFYFERNSEPIYGVDVNIQVRSTLTDDLVVIPKQLDIQFLSL